MIFNSFTFLVLYLPVVLSGTFLLARIGPNCARYWLIAASLFFYAAWNVAYLPLLIGSVVFNYVVAWRMTVARSPRARLAARSRRHGRSGIARLL